MSANCKLSEKATPQRLKYRVINWLPHSSHNHSHLYRLQGHQTIKPPAICLAKLLTFLGSWHSIGLMRGFTAWRVPHCPHTRRITRAHMQRGDTGGPANRFGWYRHRPVWVWKWLKNISHRKRSSRTNTALARAMPESCQPRVKTQPTWTPAQEKVFRWLRNCADLKVSSEFTFKMFYGNEKDLHELYRESWPFCPYRNVYVMKNNGSFFQRFCFYNFGVDLTACWKEWRANYNKSIFLRRWCRKFSTCNVNIINLLCKFVY